MQLDIFVHSRDVMLRNDVINALLRGEPRPVVAWQALQAEFPRDAATADLALLVDTLERRSTDRFADVPAARAARAALEHDITPVAKRMLRGQADDWLAQRWREMAQRASHFEGDAGHGDVHPAALWLEAGDWAAAAAAAQRVASWRRIPAPLAWVAEARCRLAGMDAAWPLLAELAWLATERLAALLPRLPDAGLQGLRKSFERDYEGEGSNDDLAWFPAWVLIEKPALAAALEAAQPGVGSAAERALRSMLALLRLERQGRHHDLVEQRKVLRGLNAALYARYMKTR